MKLTYFFLAFVFCLGFSTAAQAQNSFEILAKGATKEKYVAIKGEEIKANERYAYMFSNLSRYRLVVKPQNKDTKVLVKILDKEQNLVITNLHKKKYHHEINFKCDKTGMYYVVFEEVK